MNQSGTVKENVTGPPEGGESGELSPPSTVQFTEDRFRYFLESLCNHAGSKSELARRLDVTSQFLSAVISGRKRPGPKLLAKLEAKASTLYTITVEAANGK